MIQKTLADEMRSRIAAGQSLLKFCYLGDEGARAWDKIRGDASFHVGSREFSVKRGMLAWLRERVSAAAINLIHIGPGQFCIAHGLRVAMAREDSAGSFGIICQSLS